MSTTLNPVTEGYTVYRPVAAQQRVQSVDVLRGIMIAFMILVNDPGDWGHVFAPLDHAEWNGWTLTDLVFPTFLFLMGVSLLYSLDSRRAKGDCNKTLTGHVVLRSVKIFLLGFALVFFPRMHWQGMRIYGVLPRIAACYLLAGLWMVWIPKGGRRRAVAIGSAVVVLLAGYWAVMRWVPVPGIGLPGRDVPVAAMNQNLNDWLDRTVLVWTRHWLHTGALFHRTRDPEGLLSTFPAVASTLMGALAGMLMRRGAGVPRILLRLALAGAVCVLMGEIWSVWMPINKNLWTSSYVLLAAGWAAIALAALSWMVEARPLPWPRWLRVVCWPWLVYGSNAIVAYCVSAVIVKGMLYYRLADADGDRHSLLELTYEHGFAWNGSTEWTSLAFAVAFVVVCFLPNWWLWRRKWFLKI
jgi:predicted acyltransferase